MRAVMRPPISTAELLQGELSAHTPMMAQYLGVTFSSFADKACTGLFLGSVPSWSPSRARQMVPS